MPESLLQCLEAGVETNAYLKTKEPWKLYFKDEVIAVATFEPIQGSECQPVNAGEGTNGAQKVVAELCKAGASQSEELRAHFKDGFPVALATNDKRQRFRGVRTGSGMPKGAPVEVLLHPEDILEALGKGNLLISMRSSGIFSGSQRHKKNILFLLTVARPSKSAKNGPTKQNPHQASW